MDEHSELEPMDRYSAIFEISQTMLREGIVEAYDRAAQLDLQDHAGVAAYLDKAAFLLADEESQPAQAVAFDYFSMLLSMRPSVETALQLADFAENHTDQPQYQDVIAWCSDLSVRHLRAAVARDDFVITPDLVQCFNQVVGRLELLGDSASYQEVVQELGPIIVAAAINFMGTESSDMDMEYESSLETVAITLHESDTNLAECAYNLIPSKESKEFVDHTIVSNLVAHAFERNDFEGARIIAQSHPHLYMQKVWKLMAEKFHTDTQAASEWSKDVFLVIQQAWPEYFTSLQCADTIEGEYFGYALGMSGRLDIIAQVAAASSDIYACFETITCAAFGMGFTGKSTEFASLQSITLTYPQEIQTDLVVAYDKGATLAIDIALSKMIE